MMNGMSFRRYSVGDFLPFPFNAEPTGIQACSIDDQLPGSDVRLGRYGKPFVATASSLVKDRQRAARVRPIGVAAPVLVEGSVPALFGRLARLSLHLKGWIP
jgi:hypothetical protein